MYTSIAEIYIYRYDPSNNASRCNAMQSRVTVASTKEAYLYSSNPIGACFSIVRDLYVPPGPLVSKQLFAPLQSPFVVQSYIELELQYVFKQLPSWLGVDCYNSLKRYITFGVNICKTLRVCVREGETFLLVYLLAVAELYHDYHRYFCGSYMLKPTKQNMKSVFLSNGVSLSLVESLSALGVNVSALLSYSFYLPAYPSHSVCVDYATKCAAFIASAGVSALIPNCSSAVSGSSSSSLMQPPTVKLYPTDGTSQAILVAALSIPTGVGTYDTLPLVFKTFANNMSDASINENGYQTLCPTGFVVPEHPRDPGGVSQMTS